MNRDDVIDVLTAVAATDRRTVGEADVVAWQAIIGELPRQLALQAVLQHRRDQPGVWLEPGHVFQRARAIRRDQLEREPDEAREARQEALACKAEQAIAEIAARKAIPKFHRPSQRGVPNALSVTCPYCRAGVGYACTVNGTRDPLVKSTAHPSRIEAAQTSARRGVVETQEEPQ